LAKKYLCRILFCWCCQNISDLEGLREGDIFVVGSLQSISPTFYEQLLHSHSFAKKLQSQTVCGEKLCKTPFYDKTT
jgi:hypothetical protein